MIQGGLYRCTAYWDPQYRVWIDVRRRKDSAANRFTEWWP